MSDLHDDALARLLRAREPVSFGPGFADRVMRRVDAESAGQLPLVNPVEFLRLAAAALLLAVALATFSLSQSDDGSAQTALEAVFGLRAVTADQVFDPSDLFLGGAGAES